MYHLLISRNVFFDSDDKIRKEIFELVELVKEKDIQIVLVTRSQQKYQQIVNANLPEGDIRYGKRGQLSKKFVENPKNIMLVGAVDEDIRIAANNRILLINPLWIAEVEPNIEKYGFQLKNFKQIIQCIDILSLDTELFYDFKIDEITRLIAVSNANKYYAVEHEVEMIENYKRTLKYGKDDYKYAVYFHYLTMIIGMEDFHDVFYWMSVPSSTGSNTNNIYDIVKRTRYLLKNSRKDELFIRHSPARKSTYMDSNDRIRQGAKRHFETIKLNPKYKGKLKGKKVCVIDDYVTYGSSFECMRNLLISEGVTDIILIAIGSFKKPYYREDYTISGSVYDPGYGYQLVAKNPISIEANEKSSDIINEIHKIIKS
jgi:predicted amidophosphoribosyltransferase